MKTKFFPIALLLLISTMFLQTVKAQNFVHPGLPFTITELERMKATRTVHPWSVGWDIIASSEQASLDYEMKGPTVDVENKGNDAAYISDVIAVFYHALQWYFTGEDAHADLAISIIEPWVTTHKKWSGTSVHLHAAWRGGILAQGCEILRYTYPGWTDELTVQTEEYFQNIVWPQFRLPNPLRSANQGANNLMGGMYVAVYCNDQAKFDMCIDAFLNDACGGIQNTLPNGQHGDMGRDQGHAGAMTGNLTTVCDIAWAQGIDLYQVLDNRMLTVNEYWCKFNLGEDVDWIDHGTCYGYYTSMSEVSRGPAKDFMLGTNERLYEAYVLQKGLEAPYTKAYRDGTPYNEETFLYRGDSAYLTPATFTYNPQSELVFSDGAEFSSADVGSVGVAGTTNPDNETWTLKGSGAKFHDGRNGDAFQYAYTQMSGDGALIARLASVENTNTEAKAALVIRESLDPYSTMAAVGGRPVEGSQFNSRGSLAADGSGSQTFPLSTVPTWLKIERRGNHIVGYVGPDGKSWAPMQNTIFSLSDDYYIGLGVSSANNSVLCTSVFTDIQIGTEDVAAEELGGFLQVEAESYDAMSGIESGTTSDVSGLNDVRAIQSGDWLEYEINLPYSGTYSMDYRLAGASVNGELTLTAGDDTLDVFSFDTTGGADDWATVQSTKAFYLTKGSHTIRITANSDDWKLNWLRILSACKDVPIVTYAETIDRLGESFGTDLTSEVHTFPGNNVILRAEASTGGTWSWAGPNDFTSTESELTFDDIQVPESGNYVVTFTNECGLINTDTMTIHVGDSVYLEAENYSLMQGVLVEATNDISGSDHVASVNSGDWMEYEINVPFTALYTFDYRITGESAGSFSTSLNGNELEQISFDAGDWTTITSPVPVYLKAGAQTMRISSNSDNWKLNWIEINGLQIVKPCSLPFSQGAYKVYRTSKFWTSGAMDISCESEPGLYIIAEGQGELNPDDYLNVYYKLDGGEKMPLVEMNEAADLAMYSVENLSGTTLEIMVESEETSLKGYFEVGGIYVGKSRNPLLRIEAEDYDEKNGGSTEGCSDIDGGQNVGSIKDGNWLKFSGINMSEVNSINARLAHKSSSEGTVEIRLGSETGQLIGTVGVPNTGGWQNWQTVSAEIENTIGIYDVFVVFKHPNYYVCNMNWFKFSSEILPNTEATITSSEYAISQINKTIADVPAGVSVSIFQSNLQHSKGASVVTYQADGLSEAIEITDGCKVIVTAEDGLHKTTYTVVYLNSEADLSSTVYQVNNDLRTISNVPDALAVVLFKYNLDASEGATISIYESDGRTQAIRMSSGCKVIVRSEDGRTTNVYTVTVKTSINDVMNNEVLIYPNPAGDFLIIEDRVNSKLEIYNALGCKVLEDILKSDKHTISTKGLDKGIYFVRILNDGITITCKLIKE